MKAIKRSICAIVVAVVVGLATAASAQGQAVRQVMLRIDHVKAIKECSGSFGTLGADEIDLGAIVIDSTGNVRRRTMDLGKFGHDGSMNPVNEDFIAFKVAGGSFPKVNQVLLVLAERDGGGGFGKYLDKMMAKAQAAADAAKRAQGNVQLPGIRLVSAAAQAEAVAAELGKEIAKRLGEALLAVALTSGKTTFFPPVSNRFR